jgi:hypothetical protein
MGLEARKEYVAVLAEAVEEDAVPGLDRFLVGGRQALHGAIVATANPLLSDRFRISMPETACSGEENTMDSRGEPPA